MGVLTEHYAGAFPAWLSPVQVRAIPVAEAFNDYLDEFAQTLRERGIRVEVDTSSDRFPKKIRTASKDKIPFVVIAGGEDAEAGTVSFRFRDGSQHNGVSQAEAVELIARYVAERSNENPTAPTEQDVVVGETVVEDPATSAPTALPGQAAGEAGTTGPR